jgi:hypothetical protein
MNKLTAGALLLTTRFSICLVGALSWCLWFSLPTHAEQNKPKKDTTEQWQPTHLSKKEQKLLYSTAEDKLTKPVCTGRQRVTITCRDQKHYVTTNEYHHEVFYPYVKHLGGGHVGVGTDQNFTFIAWARSRMAWLMDYDPVVVRLNLAHRAFILHSKTRKTYTSRWYKGANERASIELLRRVYKKHPEREEIVEAYLHGRQTVSFHYHLIAKRRFGWDYHKMQAAPNKRDLQDLRDFSWMHQEEHYQYIRKMFQTNRIRIMKGDLLLTKSLRGIAHASRRLGVPIRITYLSNAEEFWRYPKTFRDNIRALPMDERSVILRTRFTSKYGPRLDAWIYIVQNGLNFQQLLAKPQYNGIDQMMRYHTRVSKGFYTIQIPPVQK